MNLLRAARIQTDQIDQIAVQFEQDDGVMGDATFDTPGNWEQLTRDEKIAWTKGRIASWLVENRYVRTDFYPDVQTKATARTAFKQLPNWATWSRDQAKAWIDTYVTNIATAKQALMQCVDIICIIRDLLIER